MPVPAPAGLIAARATRVSPRMIVLFPLAHSPFIFFLAYAAIPEKDLIRYVFGSYSIAIRSTNDCKMQPAISANRQWIAPMSGHGIQYNVLHAVVMQQFMYIPLIVRIPVRRELQLEYIYNLFVTNDDDIGNTLLPVRLHDYACFWKWKRTP